MFRNYYNFLEYDSAQQEKKMQFDLCPETLCFFQILFSQYTVFISRTVWSKLPWKLHDDIIYDTAEGAYPNKTTRTHFRRAPIRLASQIQFVLQVLTKGFFLYFIIRGLYKNIIVQDVIRTVYHKKITTKYDMRNWGGENCEKQIVRF